MAYSFEKEATIKAVTVCVVYHRNCFVIVDNPNVTGAELTQAVREQIMMPNNPNVDISDWSEDEFAVVEQEEQPLIK